jgi:uncharacterized membrane protein YtjA (UPF0391 family)
MAARSHGTQTAAIAAPAVRRCRTSQELVMLHYAVVFLVIALIAALFGFGGIASSAAGIAQVLFFIFIVLAVVGFLIGLIRR